MIVCICKNITSNTIKEMLKYTDVQGIMSITKAGTQCMTCVDTMYQLQREKDSEKAYDYESR